MCTDEELAVAMKALAALRTIGEFSPANVTREIVRDALREICLLPGAGGLVKKADRAVTRLQEAGQFPELTPGRRPANP